MPAIAAGLPLFAASHRLAAAMTPAWGFAAPFLPQMLGDFVASELHYASGLFTLMRNLGDAAGSALVNTWLQDNARATVMVQAELARVATRDAFTLGFNDVFQPMAWMLLAARVIVPFCRPGAPAPDVH